MISYSLASDFVGRVLDPHRLAAFIPGLWLRDLQENTSFNIEGRFEVEKVYDLKPPMPRDGILPPTIDLESGLGEPLSRETDFRHVNTLNIENWAILPLFDELPTALALEGLLDRRSDVVLRDRRKIDETPRRPTKTRRPRPRRPRSTR